MPLICVFLPWEDDSESVERDGVVEVDDTVVANEICGEFDDADDGGDGDDDGDGDISTS